MATVTVTQQHIDDARHSTNPTDRSSNPIARATCEALGEEMGQYITNISVGSIQHVSGKIATLPDKALEKLRSWYQHTEMEPFIFTMDL